MFEDELTKLRAASAHLSATWEDTSVEWRDAESRRFHRDHLELFLTGLAESARSVEVLGEELAAARREVEQAYAERWGRPRTGAPPTPSSTYTSLPQPVPPPAKLPDDSEPASSGLKHAKRVDQIATKTSQVQADYDRQKSEFDLLRRKQLEQAENDFRSIKPVEFATGDTSYLPDHERRLVDRIRRAEESAQKWLGSVVWDARTRWDRHRSEEKKKRDRDRWSAEWLVEARTRLESHAASAETELTELMRQDFDFRPRWLLGWPGVALVSGIIAVGLFLLLRLATPTSWSEGISEGAMWCCLSPAFLLGSLPLGLGVHHLLVEATLRKVEPHLRKIARIAAATDAFVIEARHAHVRAEQERAEKERDNKRSSAHDEFLENLRRLDQGLKNAAAKVEAELRSIASWSSTRFRPWAEAYAAESIPDTDPTAIKIGELDIPRLTTTANVFFLPYTDSYRVAFRVVRWLVAINEEVTPGQPLLEVKWERKSYEFGLESEDENEPKRIPASFTGIVAEFVVTVGTVAMFGQPLLRYEPVLSPDASWAFPLLVPFPGGFLIENDDQGSRELLQTVVLRTLTSLPPGLSTVTFIDRVGIGGSFRTLLPLGAGVVGSQVWYTDHDISACLSELLGHVESVNRSVLAGRFENLLERNARFTPSVPYRLLVIAGFPEGFTPQTADDLSKLVSVGPRCGVHVLLTFDRDRELPHGFDPSELRAKLPVLRRRGTGWITVGPGDRTVRARPEAPPSLPELGSLINRVQEEYARAAYVTMDLTEFLPSERWVGSSKDGIEITLGRRADGEHLVLRLCSNTPHMLIGGRTGRGKSNLLQVLILGCALRYPPDQVQLYLLDFRQGVEFQIYATGRLRHTPVVSSKPDPEFGANVLSYLTQEVVRRADRFKEWKVTNYENLPNRLEPERSARIVLVIDEFQVLFNDREWRDQAAKDLETLLRQGRAYGIHVVLSSQNLSLTQAPGVDMKQFLSQVDLRLAFACSEYDSKTILGGDNTAASGISRRGEVIYNDGAGTDMNRNIRLQVPFLPDEERGDLVQAVSHRFGRGPTLAYTATGLAALTADCLHQADSDRQTDSGWPVVLGEPVQIRFQPIGVTIGPEDATSLLIAGENRHAADGMMFAAVWSLAGLSDANIVILDGYAVVGRRSPFAERARALPAPNPINVVTCLDAANVALRNLRPHPVSPSPPTRSSAPPTFLFIHHLDAFIHSEDTAELLRTLIETGPAMGIYLTVSCQSRMATSALFTMRSEFHEWFPLLVLTQMSENDSRYFMDHDAAHKLGDCRAGLFHRPTGGYERFRPYGLPPEHEITKGVV